MISQNQGIKQAVNSKQISLLRIAATLAVVALHTGGTLAPVLRGSASLSAFNAVLRLLCFWAVPVFVIVSGYCLLGRQTPVLEFYRRRAARILLPLAVWSVFYLLFRAVSKSGLSRGDLASSLWTGCSYYHLWFLYMILGLYALAPWYEKIRRNFSPAGETAAVLVMSAAGWGLAQGVPLLWTTPFGQIFMEGFPVRALELFGLFAAGPLLGRLAASHRPVRLYALAFICADVAVKIYLWRSGHTELLNRLCFYYNFEAYLIGGAVFLFFVGAPDWKPSAGRARRWIEAAAQVTFGVYLVHALFIYAASRIPGLFRADALHYAASMLFVIAGSFAVCLPLKRLPYLRNLI